MDGLFQRHGPTLFKILEIVLLFVVVVLAGQCAPPIGQKRSAVGAREECEEGKGGHAKHFGSE